VIGWYVFKYRRSGISLAASWLDVALVPVIFLIAVLYWYGKLEPTRAHTVVLATAVALGVATTGTFNPVQSTKPIFTRHDTAVTRELDRRLAESPTGLLVVPFRSSFFGHTGLPLVGLGYPSVTYHTFVPNLTFWRTLFSDLPTDEFHSLFNNVGGFSVDDIAAPYRELDRAVTIVPKSTFSGPGAADHVRRAVDASGAAARTKGGARAFRVDAPIKITNEIGRDRSKTRFSANVN
jgi:hypothetical protein